MTKKDLLREMEGKWLDKWEKEVREEEYGRGHVRGYVDGAKVGRDEGFEMALKQQRQEIVEIIKEMSKRKFPRGKRRWCIQCANRIKREAIRAIKEKHESK